jgi:hypothetical protein
MATRCPQQAPSSNRYVFPTETDINGSRHVFVCYWLLVPLTRCQHKRLCNILISTIRLNEPDRTLAPVRTQHLFLGSRPKQSLNAATSLNRQKNVLQPVCRTVLRDRAVKAVMADKIWLKLYKAINFLPQLPFQKIPQSKI